MNITNNFLPPNAFSDLQQYCNENQFQKVTVENRSFLVLPTPKYLFEFLQIKDHHLVLTFIRSADKDFDTELNIHADNIVEGHKIALASVLYINDENEVSNNGTRFWRHKTHGDELQENVTNEEFNRMILKDSNNIAKWEPKDVIYAKPNKRLLYNSNAFHSKWPSKIDKGTRLVMVCFYALKTKL